MVSTTRSKTSLINTLKTISESPHGEFFFKVLLDVAQDRQGSKSKISREKLSRDDLTLLIDDHGNSLNLFAVMRLFENLDHELPKIGTSKRLAEDQVRFGQEVSLSFNPSEIFGLNKARQDLPPKLLQFGFGLFGPNGPMPNHMTEYLYEREHQYKDRHFADFADIFHHRLLSLFYRAWAINQPYVELDRKNENQFSQYIGSFCGFNLPESQNDGGVHQVTKLAHAGLFSRQVRHPEGLKAILENYFNVEVNILTWVGYWMSIPKSQQTRLGKSNGFSQLGETAVIGNKVWDVQSTFRVILGPLKLQRYLDFLPNGKSIKKLEYLVKLYFGEQYRFQLQMILKRDEVPMSWLGSEMRLGWTSWLGRKLSNLDSRDYVDI